MTDVTYILRQIEQGDPAAAEKLLPLVYEELRKLANARMAEERSDHTLQATALVHEAYLRLVDVEQAQKWNSRGHFFGAAAEAMRRILVEKARRKNREKHGGEFQRINLEEMLQEYSRSEDYVLVIDELLDDLANQNEEAAQLVKLRYFVGLSLPEAAKLMNIAPRTADRIWAYAKAWFYSELKASSQ
jgi:RNA polymerase sigma factor (TIGR02999 family)